jgi:hypothetical protein
MKSLKHTPLIELSGIIMLLIMMIIPFFLSDPEEALSSTIESFSSSHHLYSFIITILLIFFGSGSVIFSWEHFNGLPFQRFTLLLFGCTFIFASILAHSWLYNISIDNIPLQTVHRCIAGISVISFSILAISTAFLLSEHRGRNVSFLSGTAALFGVFLQSELKGSAGLWQRFIILVFAGWLIYINRYSEL